MANQEHLDLLKQGIQTWNQWRRQHPEVQPDLREVNLNGANLRGANLSNTNLSDANLSAASLNAASFSDANLSNTNLSNTNLSNARFNRADLSNASLSNANLSNVNLSNANLRGASLSNANLRGVNLSNTNLSNTNLSNANIGWTIFGDVDLSVVKGLETVCHEGPSTIGIDTIYHSKGDIPEAFLRGAGVPDSFIDYMRSLVSKPLDYYRCFISYSSRDEAFAKRLYADLQSKNVRCWFAPEDVKWGEKIRTGIDEATHLHDKLLLILSKHSVASGWVEHEVKTALTKERKEKRTVLFPIRLDKAVLDSPLAWATDIRHERNIGDFSSWKNHDTYQKAFDRLLRDLQAGPQ